MTEIFADTKNCPDCGTEFDNCNYNRDESVTSYCKKCEKTYQHKKPAVDYDKNLKTLQSQHVTYRN
jgi:hypothetical protein